MEDQIILTNKGFVYLIGAGPGDPELITAKAQNAMENADCIIYDYLANQILIEKYDCEKIYVTEIYGSYDCERFFPEIPATFVLTNTSKFKCENNTYYRNLIY